MSNILDKLKDHESRKDRLSFSEGKLSRIEEETTCLRERMGLSPIESVIFSAILQKSGSSRVNLEEIAEYLGINFVKLLSYDPEIESLRDKWLLFRRQGDVRIPNSVLASLRKDEVFQRPQTENLTTRKIIERIIVLFKNNVPIELAMKEIDEIMDKNPQTSIAIAYNKYMEKEYNQNSYKVSHEERYLFCLLIFQYEYKDNVVVSWNDMFEYFEDRDVWDNLHERCDYDLLYTMNKGVFEFPNTDGLVEKEFIKIKDSILNEILADKGGLHKKQFVCDLSPESISEKELFYNPAEKNQIDTLEGLLQQGKLHRIYESLKAKGMRTGFTCLFFGEPGTGKTETVYQLAKKTGRKIIIADVSKIKSCYVGESEKNIKAVFNDYKVACDNSDLTPILLFNEADAIFGVRKEGAQRAIDKMENSIQNIILQEMENLSGILIATTNLTQNLDRAFERRFLYKIRFSKPGKEVKEKIWSSMIPGLSSDQAQELASSYDFSGGQIENIVRKKEIESIIYDRELSFDSIRRFCNEEIIEKSNSGMARIGF